MGRALHVATCTDVQSRSIEEVNSTPCTKSKFFELYTSTENTCNDREEKHSVQNLSLNRVLNGKVNATNPIGTRCM